MYIQWPVIRSDRVIHVSELQTHTTTPLLIYL